MTARPTAMLARERALEAAITEVLRCAALPEPWAAPLRTALALPPDPPAAEINAAMLAAIRENLVVIELAAAALECLDKHASAANLRAVAAQQRAAVAKAAPQ